MTWTRTATPGAGRALCDRPGHRDRITIVAAGEWYECSKRHVGFIVAPKDLPRHVLSRGLLVPTADDLAWLRGGT